MNNFKFKQVRTKSVAKETLKVKQQRRLEGCALFNSLRFQRYVLKEFSTMTHNLLLLFEKYFLVKETVMTIVFRRVLN
jgi:hypothetical protein